MPRETSYTNTTLKEKDGPEDRPKWFKMQGAQQQGAPEKLHNAILSSGRCPVKAAKPSS